MEITTPIKSIVTYFAHRIRYRDLLKLSASIECTGTNRLKLIREGDRLQARATIERTGIDLSHLTRDRDVSTLGDGGVGPFF